MKFCIDVQDIFARYFFLKIKTLFFRGKSSRPETTPDLCYCLQSSSMHPSESGAERPFPPCRGSWSTWPYCSLSTIKYMCTYSAPTGWVCRLCNIKKKCRRCGEKCDDFYKCLRLTNCVLYNLPWNREPLLCMLYIYLNGKPRGAVAAIARSCAASQANILGCQPSSPLPVQFACEIKPSCQRRHLSVSWFFASWQATLSVVLC